MMSPNTGRPEDLPDFQKPPLSETVLSLQFAQIVGLTTAHVGLLWQHFRDQLPFVEENPPLNRVIEKFGPPTPARVEVNIQDKPPAPRVWFLNESKSELIQVQPDRFIHNWRQTRPMEHYPRYEPTKDKFRKEVAILEGFLREEGFPPLNVEQCEVTYINHIEPSGVWKRHGQLSAVFWNWSESPANAFLPEPEDCAVRLRFIIPGEGTKPIGRLHVALQPGWKKLDNSPVLSMSLTARGTPIGEGVEGAFAFFDLARRWIVKGFTDLTTPEMHQIWERGK